MLCVVGNPGPKNFLASAIEANLCISARCIDQNRRDVLTIPKVIKKERDMIKQTKKPLTGLNFLHSERIKSSSQNLSQLTAWVSKSSPSKIQELNTWMACHAD